MIKINYILPYWICKLNLLIYLNSSAYGVTGVMWNEHFNMALFHEIKFSSMNKQTHK